MKNTNTIVNKLKEHTTELLKETATLLMDDFRDGAEVVFNLVLTELEDRLEEKEFTLFCDTL